MKLFNLELKLTEQEEKLEGIVIKLLNASATTKNLKVLSTDTICLLKNDEKHFTVLVDSVGIAIQNTTYSTRYRLRDKFLSHLKDMIIEKVNEETDKYISEIYSKETNLLDNINKIL
jgi:hypothetical protein